MLHPCTILSLLDTQAEFEEICHEAQLDDKLALLDQLCTEQCTGADAGTSAG